MSRLIRRGAITESSTSFDEAVRQGIDFLAELLEGVQAVQKGETKNAMLVRLLEAEESVSDPKVLQRLVQTALTELKEFYGGKGETTDHAEELLEALSNASRREVNRALTSLNTIREGR